MKLTRALTRFAKRIERRHEGMVKAVRTGRSVEEVTHDSQFEAIAAGKGQ